VLSIFVSSRKGVTGDWIKLHNGDFHSLYSSPDIMVIKSRKMRWMGHLIRSGGKSIPNFSQKILSEDITYFIVSLAEFTCACVCYM
jgi:hypothetical protein